MFPNQTHAFGPFQFGDHRRFRVGKSKVTGVLYERMVVGSEQAGLFGEDSFECSDVDIKGAPFVLGRVVDDDPQMVFAMNFGASIESVTQREHTHSRTLASTESM